MIYSNEPMTQIRVRIAPSPTGEDLHIGNVYTALLNYVFAKANNGKFIIRIEDTDRTRLVKGSEERILASLKWVGLTYDEGPDIGGPYVPYRQSERLNLYKKYAVELVTKGHAYYCFCTSERLTKMREEQKQKNMPPMYDGYCKMLSKEDVEKNLKEGKSYVIRLNVPDTGETVFTDVIRGKISFENKLIDDQVLLKSDGYPTYHLGVVVDDYLMKITHVIRAEEWISSTPKHVLIYTFLGWPLPIFAHGPILRNPDKSKLSKRKNPVWASWYKNQGFLPEAIINYLSLMGFSMPDEKEIFSLDEMIKQFKLEDLRAVGPAFDLTKLEWMNGEYIRKMSPKDLKKRIMDFTNNKYNEEVVEKTIPLIQERMKKLSEYSGLCEFFFMPPKIYEIDIKEKSEYIKKVIPTLEKIKGWKAEVIGEAMQEVSKKEGFKNSDFFMSIRVAITGKKISPPLNESMELLGKTESLKRLIAAVS